MSFTSNFALQFISLSRMTKRDMFPLFRFANFSSIERKRRTESEKKIKGKHSTFGLSGEFVSSLGRLSFSHLFVGAAISRVLLTTFDIDGRRARALTTFLYVPWNLGKGKVDGTVKRNIAGNSIFRVTSLVE